MDGIMETGKKIIKKDFLKEQHSFSQKVIMFLEFLFLNTFYII